MSTNTDEERRFSKHVAIKATNDDEQTSTGIALKANELDRQLDFLDADGVVSMFNPAPDDGVMHAVHPEGHSSLERNEVLEADETIDGVEFSAGDWVIRRQYEDDERWNLVKSGVLAAYSIGGTVTDETEYESLDALPDDVTVPPEVDPDLIPEKYHPPTKIENGAVDEISDVDVGAVVSADHAVVKSLGAIGKDVLAETDGREEFVAVMQSRGAKEIGAEALYEYMTDAEKSVGTSDISKADTVGVDVFRVVAPSDSDYDADLLAMGVDFPSHEVYVDWHLEAHGEDQLDNPHVSIYGSLDDLGKVTDGEIEMLGTVESESDDLAATAEFLAAKADAVQLHDTMSNDDTDDASTDGEPDDATKWRQFKSWIKGETEKDEATEPDDGPEIPEVSGGDAAKALHMAKEGRSLNEDNREHLMAVHDAAETALESDMENMSTNRFTDDPSSGFSLAEHGTDKAADAADFEKHLEKLTDAQVALVREAIQQFVDSQGDADVGSLREWLWNHDEAEDLDADVLTALDVALDDFHEAQAPSNQQVTGRFADWVSNQGDNTEINMTDDNTTDDTTDSTDKDEPPAWAESLTDKVDDIDKRVSEMEDGDETEKSLEDAPEWAQTLSEKVDDLDERVETVSKNTAETTQAGGGETTGDGTDDEVSKLEQQKRELFGISGGD